MPTKRVEYNKLAATYNRRFKVSKRERTAARLQSLAIELRAKNILEVGFEKVALQPVERIVDHKVRRAVLEDPFLQKDATFQLALLTPQAYAAGLERIEAKFKGTDKQGETVVFPVDLQLKMLVGWKTVESTE